MAYTDSGLGWYANSDWMTDEADTLGEIASGGVSGYELPVLNDPTTAQIRSDGICVGHRVGSTPASYVAEFFAGQNAEQYLGYVRNYVGGVVTSCTLYLASTSVGYVWYNTYTSEPHDYGRGTWGINYVDSVTGLYYSSFSFSFDIYSVSADIPQYDTMREFLDALGTPTTSAEYAKSSAGYTVACFVKWNEAVGGNVYISPVLISTVNTNTQWTVNGNTPIQQLTEHTWQGVNFFMRLYKTHVYDPDETLTTDFPVLDIVEEEAYSSANDVFRFTALACELGVGSLPEDDPYAGAGESGPDAGDPTFDFTSEDIPVPSIPSIGAFNTGFINMYKPTVGDLRDLAHYLWSGSFDPENLRKLIANPMDTILGLHIVPATASHPAAAAATLYVGNIDTQLSMARLTEQYYELDCGTITIEPKWGAYLDYAPYSKLTLYLPYIGFVPISPDDCMGGSINVKYHVDVLSGACCVYVYCASNRGTDSHVLYSYTGACACDCPVTEGQYTNAILGILNIAGSVAGAISSGITGNAGGVTGGIENAANAALSMVKPDVSRSGSFGGSAGLMGIQYPYLVLTVPRMCTPGDQQKQEGYPSFVTKTLGQLAGYNQVQVKRLESMTCTANEAEEILTLLEGGAIF